MFGLVVSPGNVPEVGELRLLRPTHLRSIIYRISDCDPLGRTGLPYIVTVNNECAEVRGWAGWDDAIRMIASRPVPPWGVEIGNEFDLFWQHDPSDVPPAFAADLIRRAASILRPRGIKVIATSVASAKWSEYLQRLADACRDEVDYFNIHPYGQRPEGWGTPPWAHGELAGTLSAARAFAGKPLLCTEIGVKVGDAGGEEQVAAWMQAAAQTIRDLGPGICAGASWFAWRDQIGAPYERGPHAFGLRREDGSPRPAWYRFSELPSSSQEPMPMFTVGPGVLAEMAKTGDKPATDELYHPIGAPAGKHQYSETFGESGTRYVYVFSTNKTYRFSPAT